MLGWIGVGWVPKADIFGGGVGVGSPPGASGDVWGAGKPPQYHWTSLDPVVESQGLLWSSLDPVKLHWTSLWKASI